MRIRKSFLTWVAAVTFLFILTIISMIFVYLANHPSESVDYVSAAEEVDYSEICPFTYLVMVEKVNQADGFYYKINDLKCDENTNTEYVQVILSREYPKSGKKEFTAWMAAYNFAESDRLVIEYKVEE